MPTYRKSASKQDRLASIEKEEDLRDALQQRRADLKVSEAFGTEVNAA